MTFINICIKHTSYNSVHLGLRWRYWLWIRPQDAFCWVHTYKLTRIHKGTSCCRSRSGTLVRICYIHTLHNRCCLSHNPWDTPESSTWTHQDRFHLKKTTVIYIQKMISEQSSQIYWYLFTLCKAFRCCKWCRNSKHYFQKYNTIAHSLRTTCNSLEQFTIPWAPWWPNIRLTPDTDLNSHEKKLRNHFCHGEDWADLWGGFVSEIIISWVSVCLCCGPLALSQTQTWEYFGAVCTQHSSHGFVCVFLHSLLTHWHSRQPLGSCWKPNGQSCPEREQFSSGGQSSGLTVSYDGSRGES